MLGIGILGREDGGANQQGKRKAQRGYTPNNTPAPTFIFCSIYIGIYASD